MQATGMNKPETFAYHLDELHKVLYEYLANTQDQEEDLNRVALLHTYYALDMMKEYSKSTPHAEWFFRKVRKNIKTHRSKVTQH